LFNKDGLFSKKDESPRTEPRPVNVAPDLVQGTAMRPAAAPVQHDAQVSREALPAARAQGEPDGSRLIVGPDIKLKGVEITDCDTLVVEGRVEASMESRVVQIAENGIYNGTATMDVAEIRGSFNGELTARSQLVIYSTGRVSGRIRYGKIRIEEGGELSGDVSTLAGQGNTARTYAPASDAEPQLSVREPGGKSAKQTATNAAR